MAWLPVSIHAPAREATRTVPARPSTPAPVRFNPRPRAGSDCRPGRITTDHARKWFQSTPPRGKRRIQDRQVNPSGFNPRPRAGSDPLNLRHHRRWNGFNPRPRAGSDSSGRRRAAEPCFNPRPRAGSDAWRCMSPLSNDNVSIHAPAREATCCRSGDDMPLRQQGFQSTPPRGKRRVAECARGHRQRFNPRPRAGSDLTSTMLLSCRRFNPRPRAGSDSPRRQPYVVEPMFQSTPPRGKRHRFELADNITEQSFQSTPPRGKRLVCA